MFLTLNLINGVPEVTPSEISVKPQKFEEQFSGFHAYFSELNTSVNNNKDKRITGVETPVIIHYFLTESTIFDKYPQT